MHTFFEQNQTSVPEYIKQQLQQHFPNAINIEWTSTQPFFEAMFYISDTEHLAKFESSGKLQEYKRNIRLTSLPDIIRDKATLNGEIMNVIEVISNNKTFFEIICRDQNHNRRILFINIDGKLLEEKEFDTAKTDNSSLF